MAHGGRKVQLIEDMYFWSISPVYCPHRFSNSCVQNLTQFPIKNKRLSPSMSHARTQEPNVCELNHHYLCACTPRFAMRLSWASQTLENPPSSTDSSIEQFVVLKWSRTRVCVTDMCTQIHSASLYVLFVRYFLFLFYHLLLSLFLLLFLFFFF